MLEKQQLMDASLIDKASINHQGQISFNMPNSSTAIADFPDSIDFGDVISCQREINRLSMEYSKMLAERDRWRHIAEEVSHIS